MRPQFHRGNLIWISRPATIALAALALASCKSVDVPKVPGITPYRMVIQQGNFISQEMVEQLKPGMTREQVRFVLGTPLVTDIFHADRWDYVFFRELPNGKKEQRNLSVIFENDRLARVVGDLLPAEGSGPKSSGFAPQSRPATPEKPAAAPEKPAAAPEKPAATPEKPAPEAAKAAPEAAPASSAPAAPAPAAPSADTSWEPTKSNWSSPAPEPEKKAEPAPVAKEEDKKPAEEPQRGFFGRMLEKIGL